MVAYFSRPTIGGPRQIRVGDSYVGIPRDAKYIRKSTPRVLYVLHEERVHAFDDSGREVALTAAVEASAALRYFGVRRGAQGGSQAPQGPSAALFLSHFGPGADRAPNNSTDCPARLAVKR